MILRYATGSVTSSVTDQAERMPCGVGMDTPAPALGTAVQYGRPHGQHLHLFLGLVQVRNAEVHVELQGTDGIRPQRRPIVLSHRCLLSTAPKSSGVILG